MKWLPVPSVPRWLRSLPSPIRGCLSTSSAYVGASVCHAAAGAGGTWCHAPRSPRPPLAVRPCGHRALDRGAQRVERIGQPARLERGLDRHHAAADVDADRGRDDRALGRHDAADGRADPEVHVGHHRDVAKHDRQPRQVAELLQRGVLDADAARPRLDRHPPALDQLVAVLGVGVGVGLVLVARHDASTGTVGASSRVRKRNPGSRTLPIYGVRGPASTGFAGLRAKSANLRARRTQR